MIWLEGADAVHEEKYFRKLQILEKSLACNKERVLQSPGLRGNIQQPAIHTIAMCGPDQILREEKGVGNEKVSRQMKKFHLKKEGNTVWPKLTKICYRVFFLTGPSLNLLSVGR